MDENDLFGEYFSCDQGCMMISRDYGIDVIQSGLKHYEQDAFSLPLT